MSDEKAWSSLTVFNSYAPAGHSPPNRKEIKDEGIIKVIKIKKIHVVLFGGRHVIDKLPPVSPYN